MKRVFVASALWLAVSAAPSIAQDKNQKHLEGILKRMDPATRLEQVCDAEAMRRIARDNREFRIDRSVVSALLDPQAKGDVLIGKGGAFRSKGKWYQFTFTCQASPDRLRVLSFEYQLGEEIPETQWSKHGLYQ